MQPPDCRRDAQDEVLVEEYDELAEAMQRCIEAPRLD
jgi:hypothetical protein